MTYACRLFCSNVLEDWVVAASRRRLCHGRFFGLSAKPLRCRTVGGRFGLYWQNTRHRLGAAALAALALGMNMLLIAAGLTAGAILPKSGEWMEEVKKFFGMLLLAVAVWVISPLIPIFVQMLYMARF